MKTAFSKYTSSKTLFFLGIGILAMAQTAFGRTLVDLNANDGRQDSYTKNADYNWIINSGTPSATFNGLTFKLSKDGAGSEIRAVNLKTLTKADGSSPTLTQDGVTVKDADKGGRIKLEISGLSAGTHTITTYHSYVDNWSNGSPVSITVNGTKTVSGLKVPTRVTNDWDAGIAHSVFTASGTVTVLITPDDANKNGAVLNAFEIDGVDPAKSISRFSPKDREKHHEIKNGISWKAGSGAKSHDVYIGTDYNRVFNATKTSAEFKGNQAGTVFNFDNSYSSVNIYYWRVDEVGDGGTVKGAVYSFQVARLAFPTAEGYGRFARGGRGGRIVEVTNLNDAGAGSLREALEVEKGPRIVVFKVAGVIALKSRLVVPSDGGDVYVAGQTAPGPITLINYDFGTIGGSDIVFRHIRTRVGEMNGKSTGGMGLASADHTIIDHCSISWATDEGFSSRGAKNISFQWNIIGESLNNSVHYGTGSDPNDHTGTERHAFAASISGYVGSFHHNLLINNTGRNWSLAGGLEQDALTYGGNVDIRNNVVYNWRDRTTDGGVRRLDFVNNYYKAGALSNTNMHIVSMDGDEVTGGNDWQMMYVSGNKMVDNKGSVLLAHTDNAWDKKKAKWGGKGAGGSDAKVRSNTPFFEPYVKTETADQAYNSVISRAGAGFGVKSQGLDYIDARYIDEVKNNKQTYTGSRDKLKGFIDTQDDAGGYPTNAKFKIGTAYTDKDKDGMDDAWESAKGLNPNDAKDGNYATLSADGYTNLEMFLNELAGDDVVYNGSGINPISSSSVISSSSSGVVSPITAFCADGKTGKFWNFSDSKFTSGLPEDITASVTVDDLTFVPGGATMGYKGDNSESIDGHDFTHRLELGNAGSATSRALHFTLGGKAQITVYAISGREDTPRPIALFNGSSELQEVSFPGNAVSKGVYNYTGESSPLHLYSKQGGIHIYGVKVECENTMSIVRTPNIIPQQATPLYYSLKGEPLGSIKPQKAGVYIVKRGSTIQKIIVR
jgi:hypothetical protein